MNQLRKNERRKVIIIYIHFLKVKAYDSIGLDFWIDLDQRTQIETELMSQDLLLSALILFFKKEMIC